MKQYELQKYLGMTESKFYLLRATGIIPAPTTGSRLRKTYSEDEVKAIVKKLKEEGIK